MAKLILVTFPLFVYFTEVLVDHNIGVKGRSKVLVVFAQFTALQYSATASAVPLKYEVIIW